MKKLSVLLLLLPAVLCFPSPDDKEANKEWEKRTNIKKFLLITEIAKQAEIKDIALEHNIKRLLYEVDKKETAEWNASLKEQFSCMGIVHNDSSGTLSSDTLPRPFEFWNR